MTGTDYKRSHYFVQRAFQGRFIAWMVGLLILSGLCSGLLLYLLLGSDLLSETRSVHVRLEQIRQDLGITILLGNLLITLLIGLLAGFMVLHISHRIAGPLFRLQRLFKQVAAGRYDIDASLRDDDQLQELAVSFTGLTRELSRQQQQRQEKLREGIELIEKLRQETGSDTSHATLARLEQVLSDLRTPAA